MTQIKVNNSSVIASFEYDLTRKDLKVIFKSKKSYIYTPVSVEFFKKLQNSQSKGKFFNRNIRDNEALNCLKVIK